jgi:hypothetical protein
VQRFFNPSDSRYRVDRHGICFKFSHRRKAGSTLTREGCLALNEQFSGAEEIHVFYELGEYTGGSPEDPRVFGVVPEEATRLAQVVAEDVWETWPDKRMTVAERGTVEASPVAAIFVDISALLSYPMSYFRTICTVYTRDGGWFREDTEGSAVYLGVDEKYWNDSLNELEGLVDAKSRSYVRKIKKSA